MAIFLRMNGADPTTPEEIERILRSAERPRLPFEDEWDDFASLMRVLSGSNDFAGTQGFHQRVSR